LPHFKMRNMRGVSLKSGVHQAGFTLVEIAIVLVIIGLLLGGVLKGQELISSAKVRSLNDKVSGFTAAWYGFNDRYRGVPGDYNAADSTILATLDNGGGDGLVNSSPERGQVWAHLQAAGLISGNFDGITTGLSYTCATTRCPDNGFSRGMMISYGNEGQSNGGNANELVSGASIPVEILAELDRKIDDGNASTGFMQLGNGGSGWGTASSTACFATPLYNVLTPSTNCAAVFRNLN